MKKLFLLLLVPLILATQCEDDLDSGFETTYLIENTSSLDLTYLSPEDNLVQVPLGETLILGSTLNSVTSPILPSEAFIFNRIKLYNNQNDNFILVYNQEPITNELWEFSEPTVNEFEYKLIITDDLLD